MLRLRKLWWSLGFALIALITALSLLPIQGPQLDLPNGDKLNHAFAYIVLTLYFGQLAGPELRRRLLLVVALIGYGISIECLQALLPPRMAELADLAANLAGITIGWLLLPTALGRILSRIESQLPRRPSL
jgi:VanZ family protein